MSEQKSHKINKSQNDKIVHLIKSKLTPMHKKQKVFPRILDPIDLNFKENRNYTCGGYMYRDYPIVEKLPKFERDPSQEINANPIFKKVQNHIEEKKKVVSEEEMENARSRRPRISLGEFIDLFSRSEETDYSKTTTQFSKFKRESLTLNMFDNFESSAIKQEERVLNETEIVLMNAKFRKQLNHKKLIGTWKGRNKN